MYAVPVSVQHRFVLKEKLNTEERLLKLNIITSDHAHCPFCQEVPETASHLFSVCPATYSLWGECLACWELCWCSPMKPLSFFQAWCGVTFKGVLKNIWITLFYVVIWTTWNTGNKLIFEKIKRKLAYWVNGWLYKIQSISSRVI